MGLAFGFTLLSHVRTEIYVSVFVLSVHAEYLLFKSPRRRRVFSPVSPFYFSPKCGVAVGISLLSCMQAEIIVIAYVLPVNVVHL